MYICVYIYIYVYIDRYSVNWASGKKRDPHGPWQGAQILRAVAVGRLCLRDPQREAVHHGARTGPDGNARGEAGVVIACGESRDLWMVYGWFMYDTCIFWAEFMSVLSFL